MKVTLNKGGTDEKRVEASAIAVPDLWHLAHALPEPSRAAVLETWHLAHDLRAAVQGPESVSVVENERLRSALCECLSLLRNSEVQYVICNGEGSNLGEQALYHRVMAQARQALKGGAS